MLALILIFIRGVCQHNKPHLGKFSFQFDFRFLKSLISWEADRIFLHLNRRHTSVPSNLEFLQRSDSGIKTVLWKTAGEKEDSRLFWSLPVHLFRIHIKVLQLTKTRAQHAWGLYADICRKQSLCQHADLWEVGDVSLAEGHVFRLLYDVSVNDKNVGELCSEAQLDLGTALKVQTRALGKLWKVTQTH